MIKQVIVVRKDLNMRKGKIAAQVSHAAMKIFFDLMKYMNLRREHNQILYKVYEIDLSPEMAEWKEGLFKKIVVGVDSEQELYDIYMKGKESGLPTCMIRDSGLTEFHGVQTYTCCAIGPAKSEEIDKITGHLKPL